MWYFLTDGLKIFLPFTWLDGRLLRICGSVFHVSSLLHAKNGWKSIGIRLGCSLWGWRWWHHPEQLSGVLVCRPKVHLWWRTDRSLGDVVHLFSLSGSWHHSAGIWALRTAVAHASENINDTVWQDRKLYIAVSLDLWTPRWNCNWPITWWSNWFAIGQLLDGLIDLQLANYLMD